MTSILAGYGDVEDVDRFVSWLRDVGTANDCAVQAFDARYVPDEQHVETAVARANRAFERGENVARDRSVEILLYAAGRRQIDQAVEMGVHEGEGVPMVVVVDPDSDVDGNEGGAVEAIRRRIEVDDTVLEGERDETVIREFFDIGDVEVEVAATDLAGLVRERVALLDVEK